MFGQYQSMMGTWQVRQSFGVGVPSSGHRHPLRWGEGLAQPTEPPLTPSCALPSQSTPLACDFVSKLSSPGERRNQEVTTRGLDVCEPWSQTDVGPSPPLPLHTRIWIS